MSIDVLIFTFFECFFLAELCSLWKDCFCFVKRQQQQKKAKKMPYFTAEGRQNLKKYKYHGVDKSLLANHIGQPFWRAAVNWLPMSLAPNLVTLIGFCAIIAQYSILAFYCPNLEGEAPRWVYAFTGFCVWFYQTMDALDGKQARRTGCSSPMGEIFDHGCDALSLSLLFISTCTTAQIGLDHFWLPVTLGAGIASFFLTQWEEYHTDILYLGYVNVTEAQVAIIAIQWTAAYAGPLVFAEVWTLFGVSLTLGRWVLCLTIAGAAFSGLSNAFTLVQFYAKKNPSKLFTCVLQLIPLIQILACLLWWPQASPEIFNSYVHFILMGCGTLASIAVGELVLFRVAEQKYPVFHPLLLACLVPFVFPAVPALQAFEGMYAIAFGVFGVIAYFVCARAVLLELSEIFGIAIFTIPAGGYSFNKKN